MRPAAIEPRPGQESVWDYPRPPALVPYTGHIKIFDELTVIAECTGLAYRVLETSHPPTFYLPPSAIQTELLHPMTGSSHCEWKGEATYFRLEKGDRRIERVAWTYPTPNSAFTAISGYFAFYPSKVNCFVDGQSVTAQEGDFYGGWITPQVVGPFKGGPSTWGW